MWSFGCSLLRIMLFPAYKFIRQEAETSLSHFLSVCNARKYVLIQFSQENQYSDFDEVMVWL